MSPDRPTPLPVLPATRPWFACDRVAPGILRLTEPLVCDFMRANIWVLRGRDRDLVVDAGNGVAPLPPALPAADPARRVVVATHAHADHSGGLRDFAAVACHASVAAALAAADPAATLAGPHYAPGDLSGLIVGPPRLAGPLVRALPAGFDPRRFGPQPLAAVQPLAEGDVIDLGDRRLTVLHVPGHSPGCIALHDPENGLLLSGDALYDDAEPVAGLHHSDPAAFSASLGRLARLQVRLVLPGHGEAFDGARLAARAAAWRALLG